MKAGPHLGQVERQWPGPAPDPGLCPPGWGAAGLRLVEAERCPTRAGLGGDFSGVTSGQGWEWGVGGGDVQLSFLPSLRPLSGR